MSPIKATAVPAFGATRYQVTVADVPHANPPAFTWYLHLTAAAAAGACNDAPVAGGQRLSATEYAWPDQSATFLWYHGSAGSVAGDRRYSCGQAALGRSPGTVTVVAENEFAHCSATFDGLVAGAAREGQPAGCALGGYTLAANLLPVPSRLLTLYRSLTVEVAQVVERARAGKLPPAAALADELKQIVAQQQHAFGQLFPPVWGCSFDSFFNDVVAARAALAAPLAAGTTSSQALVGADAQATAALARAVDACKRTSTSPGGAPPAVTRALAQLADGAAALGKLGSTTELSSRRSQLSSSLEAIVSGEFPRVFGLRFIDLVAGLGSEQTAAAAAEHAASSDDTGQALSALEGVLGETSSISTGLERTQKHVIALENSRS